MVPVAGLPAEMLLTLHVTLVSVVPVTVAVKVCWLPKSTETVAGVTVTLMEDGVGVGGGVGGGGGWTTAESPLAQPATHVTVAKRTKIVSAGKCGCDA
jgi:hypothetical protein